MPKISHDNMRGLCHGIDKLTAQCFYVILIQNTVVYDKITIWSNEHANNDHFDKSSLENKGVNILLSFLLMVCDDDDKEKVKHIYKKYHHDMLKYAKVQLKKMNVPDYEMEAEDVVQASFLKISRYIKKIQFDMGEGAVKSYVFAIVLNEAINSSNEYVATVNIDDCYEVSTEDEFFEQLPIKEDYEKVIQAIQRLDDKYRYTLMLRYTHDMSVKEISQLMGLPEKTVYTRLERGRKQLLVLLEKEGISYV